MEKFKHQFQVTIRNRNISKEDIIIDLQNIAKELNKNTVTSLEYDEKGKFGKTTVLRKLKSWNNALIEAGLSAPNSQNVSNEELFENIAQVWIKLGRQPLYKEVDKSLSISKFSVGTYELRFGSWSKTLLMFQSFISQSEVVIDKVIVESTKYIKKGASSRTDRRINWRLRAQVLIRDNCVCKMCGIGPSKDSSIVLHVDHIKPWSKGGETVIENLQTLCSVCNVGKSNFE